MSKLITTIRFRTRRMLKLISNIRFRTWFMSLGILSAVLLSILMDPDMGFITQMPFGAALAAQLVIMSKAFLFIALLHYARRGIMDYVDLEVLFEKAKTTPEGAGSAIVGVGLMMLALSVVIYTAVHA